MLGEDLERAIRDAWLRIRQSILSDPQKLHRRLARRRMKSLTRPLRPWCLAIRASDRRITPAHWVIYPEHAMDLDHPEHAYEPIEHEVTIQTHALRRYCHPVIIARPGEEVTEVAKKLGVHPSVLHRARSQGVYQERFYEGLGGKLGCKVPVIYSRELLDPGSRNFFAAPHPLWQPFWERLVKFIPDDFEQAVIRRPFFRMVSGTGTPACRPFRKSRLSDDPEFLGYVWLCPACKKQVRTIYFPVAVPTLFDCWFTDPVIQLKLSDADLPNPPPPTFACYTCHGIVHISSISPNCWNHFISHQTRGLLFGHEVPKPATFIPHRKRTRIRRLSAAAPRQRQVLVRLSNGWSNQQIALNLGITLNDVRNHTSNICRQENVANRQALAKKLNFAKPLPLNAAERAPLRRTEVEKLILQGYSNQQMAQELKISKEILNHDILMIYKAHGLSGRKSKARQALAEKLGVLLPPNRLELLRQKVAELRERGLLWKEISRQLKIPWGSIPRHISYFRRHSKGILPVSP